MGYKVPFLLAQADGEADSQSHDECEKYQENQTYPSPTTSSSDMFVVPHVGQLLTLGPRGIPDGVFWWRGLEAPSWGIAEVPSSVEGSVMGSSRHGRSGGGIFFDNRESDIGGVDGAGSAAFGAVVGMTREGGFGKVVGGYKRGFDVVVRGDGRGRHCRY